MELTRGLDEFHKEKMEQVIFSDNNQSGGGGGKSPVDFSFNFGQAH